MSDESDTVTDLAQEQTSSTLGQETLRKKIARTSTKTSEYPLLDTIFDAFVVRTSRTTRQLYGVATEIALKESRILRFGEFAGTLEQPCLLGVFEIPEWSDSALAILDGMMVENMIELMLGANVEEPLDYEARTPTSLDRDLAIRAVDLMLADLALSFTTANAEIGAVTMRCRRTETRPKFAAITRDSAPVLIACFTISLGTAGRCGEFSLVIPLAAFEPVRRQLQQTFRGEQRRNDRIWIRHIAAALLETPIDMTAQLTCQSMTVADLEGFAVGDMIPLEVSSRPEISLWIDGFKDSEPLMTGQLGRWRGQKGVRISKPAPLGFADPMITLMEELE
jgi:flagellar motor switch protein FliM